MNPDPRLTTLLPTIGDTPRGFKRSSIAEAEFLSLPPPKGRCPFSDLSRSTLIELINRGLVASVSLRRPGTIRGKRLVVKQSLADYLYGKTTPKHATSESLPGWTSGKTSPTPSAHQVTPATETPTPAKPAVRRTDEPLDQATADAIRRNPPKYLNIAEAAAYLGVSPRTIREHIAARRLSHVRFGGRVLLRPSDIDRDMERLLVRSLP